MKTADEQLASIGLFQVPDQHRIDKRYEATTGEALEISRYGADIIPRYSGMRFRISRDCLFAIAQLVKEMGDGND